MSDAPQGPGWWMANDGRWYPAESRQGSSAAPPPIPGATWSPPPPPNPPPTYSPATPASGPAATPPPRPGLSPWILAAGAAMLIALTALTVILLTRDTDNTATGPDIAGAGNATTTVTAAPTTAAPETTVAPTIAPAPAAPAPAPVGDVANEASGQLCKDLKAKGYSYSAAVDYWRANGQTNSLDADKNGIPCETVYPRSDIVSYWPASTYNGTVSYGLPSGLLCRDLEARGVGVYDALRYYIYEGYPSRMDADGNGIPCETVYPDAEYVWLYETW